MVRRWRSRRAAKAYATRLGPWLRRAFGTSATYKQGQIERGIRELRLDPDYALFGYALFLDRAAFDALLGALPDRAAFEEVRAALMRELGQPPRFAGSPARPDEGHGHHAHAGGGHNGGDADAGGGAAMAGAATDSVRARERPREKRPPVKRITSATEPSA